MDKVSFVIMLFRCFNNVWSNDMYYRVCAKWTYFDQNNFFFKVMVKITPTTYSLFTWNVTHHHKNPIPCERRVCGRCFCITFFFFFIMVETFCGLPKMLTWHCHVRPKNKFIDMTLSCQPKTKVHHLLVMLTTSTRNIDCLLNSINCVKVSCSKFESPKSFISLTSKDGRTTF